MIQTKLPTPHGYILEGPLNKCTTLSNVMNSEVKPHKVIIALKRVTFPVIDFWCSLPHIIHPIIVGVYG